MSNFFKRFSIATTFAVFGGLAHADDLDTPNSGMLIADNSFISAVDQTDYLQRTYGYALWRHWEHVPQELRDNFSVGEDNPIWQHHYFLRQLEKNLGSAPSDQHREIFDKLAKDILPEDVIPSVQHYLPVIQTYLEEISDKTEYEATLMDRYLASVEEAHPHVTIEESPDLSDDEDISHFTRLHSDTATGRGVKWGEYGVAHSLEGDQVIATDFLMDCVAVVLTSEDPNNPEDRYAVLAHVDATTEPRKAIEKLLSEIPEGHIIKAQILGSDRNENAYMNVALAEALVLSGRISSLAINTDGATTVAVHAASGTILSSNDPEKGEHNAYVVDTLPVQVEFSGEQPYQDFRSLSYSQLRGMRLNEEFEPTSVLVRTAHPTLPNETHPSLDSLVDSAREDKEFTKEELDKIAIAISQNMFAPNGVCIYQTDDRVVADLGTETKVIVGYKWANSNVQYYSEPTGPGCTAPSPP